MPFHAHDAETQEAIKQQVRRVDRNLQRMGMAPMTPPEIRRAAERIAQGVEAARSSSPTGVPDASRSRVFGQHQPMTSSPPRTLHFQSAVPMDRALGPMMSPQGRVGRSGFGAMQPFLNDDQRLLQEQLRRRRRLTTGSI